MGANGGPLRCGPGQNQGVSPDWRVRADGVGHFPALRTPGARLRAVRRGVGDRGWGERGAPEAEPRAQRFRRFVGVAARLEPTRAGEHGGNESVR